MSSPERVQRLLIGGYTAPRGDGFGISLLEYQAEDLRVVGRGREDRVAVQHWRKVPTAALFSQSRKRRSAMSTAFVGSTRDSS